MVTVSNAGSSQSLSKDPVPSSGLAWHSDGKGGWTVILSRVIKPRKICWLAVKPHKNKKQTKKTLAQFKMLTPATATPRGHVTSFCWGSFSKANCSILPGIGQYSFAICRRYMQGPMLFRMYQSQQQKFSFVWEIKGIGSKNIPVKTQCFHSQLRTLLFWRGRFI